MKKLFIATYTKALILFVSPLIIYSCGGGGGDKPNGPITPSVVPVTSVTLSKTSAEMEIGNTLQLTATVSPSNATDKSVTWGSSNSSVATVTPTGLVTAKAEGSANVTASCGGKSATCKVTVKKPVVAVTSVELDKTEITLDAEETYNLKATIKPDDATDKTVVWESSKTSVATVDSNGKVKGIDNGVASVTATCGGKSASCKVNVVVRVKSVTLTPSSATLIVNETPLMLKLTIVPDNAANKTIQWYSSNTNVVKVKDGEVSALTYGNAIIKAVCDGKEAECNITAEMCKAVDLGLTVKWADRNIGASSSESFGNYFAWGEIIPKTAFSWDNYKWGTNVNITKYNSADNLMILEPSDDAASVNFGGNWRMPTEEDFMELCYNCTKIWTTVNNVKGFLFTSKINGNSIFFPAGGLYTESGLQNTGVQGFYWSSSWDKTFASGALHFEFSARGFSNPCNGSRRFNGYSIRAVTK